MIRKLFAQFNSSLSERIVPQRFPFAVPVKLTFEQDKATGNLQTANLWISGETKDLSQSGIAFTVSSIRLKENYLVGENRTLNAELDLPNGKIQMKIVGVRYEPLGETVSAAKYLIGAKITQITQENKEVYEDFLKNGKKMFKPKMLRFETDKR